MIEEKDKEISRLLDDNKCLHESLDRRSLVCSLTMILDQDVILSTRVT